MTKTRVKVPYWIITSFKRGAIWEKPYLSESECLLEYNSKMSALRKEKGDEFMKKVDWKIEKHWYEMDKSKSDDDFDKF